MKRLILAAALLAPSLALAGGHRSHLDLFADEAGFAHLGATLGAGPVHGLVAVGWQPEQAAGAWSTSLGVGLHLGVVEPLWVDLDYLHSRVAADGGLFSEKNALHTWRGMAVARVAPFLGLTAGVTWNEARFSSVEALPFVDSSGQPEKSWMGFQVGVQLF